jgi:flagella basal body P-ring formation protein FlgA
MATTSFKTFKVKRTAAQLKTAKSNAIDMPQHAAPCKGYAWSIAKTELRGTLPEVLHLKAVPSSL